MDLLRAESLLLSMLVPNIHDFSQKSDMLHKPKTISKREARHKTAAEICLTNYCHLMGEHRHCNGTHQ